MCLFPPRFRVKPLLAEAQGLKRGQQHPLPWYPPVCVTLADIPEGPRAYDHIQSVRDRTKIPLRLYDISMKDVSEKTLNIHYLCLLDVIYHLG